MEYSEFLRQKQKTHIMPIDGYDIQHIPGKQCYSCGGTGYHEYYSNTPPYKVYDQSYCWHCINGWYKLPQWICLARIKFGEYTFHRPLKREYMEKNPFTKEEMGYDVSTTPIINGYIEHNKSRYATFARFVLYLIYNRTAIPELFKGFGVGYYFNWWSIRRFTNNVWHIVTHGHKAIPLRRTITRIKEIVFPTIVKLPTVHSDDNEELPF